MNTADLIVLNALEPYMTDLGYAFVLQEVEKAGGVRQLTNSIAIMELEVAKKKFGSRSAAGRYAAEIRWQGEQKEFLLPNREGIFYRTATIDGKEQQMEVKDTAVTAVKVGDIMSPTENQTPSRVKTIKDDGNRLQMTVVDTNNGNTAVVSVPKTKNVKVWSKQEPQSTGSLDTKTRINPRAITLEDKKYIEAGKTSPERIRRKNEIIDMYAAQGKDVTSMPRRTTMRGGRQWLGLSQ